MFGANSRNIQIDQLVTIYPLLLWCFIASVHASSVKETLVCSKTFFFGECKVHSMSIHVERTFSSSAELRFSPLNPQAGSLFAASSGKDFSTSTKRTICNSIPVFSGTNELCLDNDGRIMLVSWVCALNVLIFFVKLGSSQRSAK